MVSVSSTNEIRVIQILTLQVYSAIHSGQISNFWFIGLRFAWQFLNAWPNNH